MILWRHYQILITKKCDDEEVHIGIEYSPILHDIIYAQLLTLSGVKASDRSNG